MKLFKLNAIKCWFLIFVILTQGSETSERSKKPGTETPTRPYHIAFVSGCDSHLFILLPTAFSLLRKSSSPDKYRATFVIGAECQKTAMNLGDDVGFHDTGRWMYPNYDPSISVAEYYENVTLGSYLNAKCNLWPRQTWVSAQASFCRLETITGCYHDWKFKFKDNFPLDNGL